MSTVQYSLKYCLPLFFLSAVSVVSLCYPEWKVLYHSCLGLCFIVALSPFYSFVINCHCCKFICQFFFTGLALSCFESVGEKVS